MFPDDGGDHGLDFAFEGVEDEVAGLSDAAADDEGVGVEEPGDGREGGAEPVGDFAPDTAGDFVTGSGGFGDGFGGAVGEIFVDSDLGVGFDGVLGDLEVAGVFFECAEVAVVAGDAVEVDAHLTDFAGGVLAAAVHLAIEDEAAADAGAEGEGDDVAEAASGAIAEFGPGHGVGVIFDDDGEAGFV